jgi:hypothetical protein
MFGRLGGDEFAILGRSPGESRDAGRLRTIIDVLRNRSTSGF